MVTPLETENEEAKVEDQNEDEHHSLRYAGQVPILTYKLPASISAAAALIPALMLPEDYKDNPGMIHSTHCTLVIQWIATVGAKFILIYYLAEIFDNAQDNIEIGNCETLSTPLVITSLVVFVVTVLKELEVTFQMGYTITNIIPTVSHRSKLLFKKREDGGARLDRVGSKAGNANDRTPRQNKKQIIPETASDVQYLAGGCTVLYKTCAIIFVVLPEVISTLALLVEGGAYLTASNSDADVLLNTLALEFVLYVDENALAFFCSKHVNLLVDAFPAFDISKRAASGTWRQQWVAWSPLVKMIFVGTIVWLYYFLGIWCGHVGAGYWEMHPERNRTEAMEIKHDDGMQIVV
mmetsp:Transcript_4318/g.4983  ORF Transcript_4318/g.4983 Transcript_4318/m.4983 type:complete len:351 (-) Transcript_4318:204-1256(-)|eukprot:CAMPEP_0197853216 /NCGR_PEP_ID=MMETSP1438-20131217/22300_1 /TAXON_ID=1461541 /ORGANISM="Pterosperma sp., Strain CCMP1384" /LENGTH=350 /DNA_ID=CAMNT_0043467539 /DNA_START=277 /DNA_END=1329 /DNA_ORIENTATION=+